MANKRLTVIDFFSGAGGFHLGFEKAGFDIALAIDSDTSVKLTHENNYRHIPIISKDIKDIKISEVENIVGGKEVDVFIGGPPCQGFSSMGKRDPKDPRNSLFIEYLKFVKHFKPRVVVMENVRGILHMKGGKTINDIKKEFRKAGYHNFDLSVLNAADYGVPQIRHRVFFIGNNLGLPIKFPEPDHFKKPLKGKRDYKTVGEAINDLVDVDEFPNHTAMNHNEIVKKRMKYIPEGRRLMENKLPESLSFGSRKDFKSKKVKNFSHVYKRLHRGKPATTMVPGHNAFPVHPVLNRTLTPREAARIQTFPDKIIFHGTRQEQCIQVGNAVPPLLSEKIARVIKKQLTDHLEVKFNKSELTYYTKIGEK